jgi:ABC-type multidrug transport system fused ATPase/permease subunit
LHIRISIQHLTLSDAIMDPALDPPPVHRALEVVRYAYPASVFVAYCVTSLVALVKLHAIKAAKRAPETARRRVSLVLVAIIALSYLAQVVALVGRALVTGATIGPDSLVVGWLSAILVFGIQFGSLEGSEHPVWYIHGTIWTVALVCEIAVLALSVVAHDPSTLGLLGAVNVGIAVARVCIVIGLVGTTAVYHHGGVRKEPATDEEREGLLSGAAAEAETSTGESSSAGASGNYGTTTTTTDAATTTTTAKTDDKTKKRRAAEMPWKRRQREARERMQERLESNGNIFTYIKSFSIFWPYIWPANNRRLQSRLVLVACCMLVGNALNLLVPRQFGIIMDDLATLSGSRIFFDVALYIGLRLLASESGVSLLKTWLMIPVRIFSSQTLKIAAYSHIMHLSADFHDSTSYSEMWNATYGGQRMTVMLERMLFSTVPMFIDMVLAFAYLSTILGPYEALISIASGVMFVYLAARMVARRDGAVRELEELTAQEWQIKSNGLDNWQTVNSFNQVQHECDRYRGAVKEQTDADRSVQFGWQTASAMQSLALMAGLAASAVLAVVRIRQGKATPGQFAMLLSYWSQLSSPLRYFIDLGKDTKEDLVYCERLLHIMSQKPTIANNGTQKLLRFDKGEVRFENVSFSYDKKKQIIKNLSFTAEGGKTVALVGATGSGKSTILKLLNRFYDVCDGSVKVDGQDLRDVDLYSLRDRIGVVPQSVALFADSIMNNVRYARLGATDEEVYAACKAACMHDKILTFTDGYDSFVGDRGIKLSGGEQQRVAIARAILKDPDIVLLDEATSAVDTDTEQKIQASFQALCQGRTTFVVAHRLSTVKNADRIIVIGEGEILEDGTHDELLARNGRYANLWRKQGFVRPETEAEKVMGIHDDVHPDPECDLEEADDHVSTSSSSTVHDSADESSSKGKQAVRTPTPTVPAPDAKKAPASKD